MDRRKMLTAIAVGVGSPAAFAADLGGPSPKSDVDDMVAMEVLTQALRSLRALRATAPAGWIVLIDVLLDVATRLYDQWRQQQSSEELSKLLDEISRLRTDLEKENAVRDRELKELRSISAMLLLAAQSLKGRRYKTCGQYRYRGRNGRCLDARDE